MCNNIVNYGCGFNWSTPFKDLSFLLVVTSYQIKNNYVFTRETKTCHSLLNASNIDKTLKKDKSCNSKLP